MSTILNALHKQATNQACNVAGKRSNSYWKIGLLTALLMVIVLLATLIFIVVNPRVLTALTATQAEPVVTAAVPVRQEKIPVKVVGKIYFQTKPLPILADEIRSEDTANTAAAASDSGEQIVLSGEKKSPEVSPQIDYSDVSDDLAARFQHALAMQAQDARADISEQALSTALTGEGNEADDGSDIRQMSSAFQEKVPSMSYDSHMYSSVAEDRWIRINGEDLKEGQFTSSGKVQVVEIQPNRTIFRLGKQSFSVESLTDWKGL